MDKHNIPAGFAYSFVAKLSKAPLDSETYTDITDPAEIPSANWALCLVNAENVPELSLPLDWSQMTAEGLLLITMTARQTLALSGKCLRAEVRNDAGTSDLMDGHGPAFFFIPNRLHN